MVASAIQSILDKAVAGERLAPDEGLQLLESHDLAAIGRAADAVTRRLHPEPFRTYNIDRNINYTNVCAAVCDFCAFYRKAGRRRGLRPRRATCCCKKIQRDRRAGRRSDPDAGRPASRTSSSSGTRSCSATSRRTFPQVNIHGFSPPEIYHFTKVTKLPLRDGPASGSRRRAWAACPAAAARSSSIASARRSPAARC